MPKGRDTSQVLIDFPNIVMQNMKSKPHTETQKQRLLSTSVIKAGLTESYQRMLVVYPLPQSKGTLRRVHRFTLYFLLEAIG